MKNKNRTKLNIIITASVIVLCIVAFFIRRINNAKANDWVYVLSKEKVITFNVYRDEDILNYKCEITKDERKKLLSIFQEENMERHHRGLKSEATAQIISDDVTIEYLFSAEIRVFFQNKMYEYHLFDEVDEKLLQLFEEVGQRYNHEME